MEVPKPSLTKEQHLISTSNLQLLNKENEKEEKEDEKDKEDENDNDNEEGNNVNVIEKEE